MENATRATLLERLRDGGDALAWQEFFDLYWRAMYAFARHCGASDQAAQDAVQDVLLTVFEQKDVFRYDPSRGRFRNWLCTLVRQKLAARRRKEAHEPRAAGHGDDGPEAPSPIDDARPDEIWEAVFERSLLLALLAVVRREVGPETYQAFDLTALHGLSGQEAAQLTGLTRNAVYLARKRVTERLRELGASYAASGELDERVREALELVPDSATERSLTARMQTTFGARARLGG